MIQTRADWPECVKCVKELITDPNQRMGKEITEIVNIFRPTPAPVCSCLHPWHLLRPEALLCCPPPKSLSSQVRLIQAARFACVCSLAFYPTVALAELFSGLPLAALSPCFACPRHLLGKLYCYKRRHGKIQGICTSCQQPLSP